MTVHFLRTAVGAESLEALIERQEVYSRRWDDGSVGPALHTRRWPRRAEELLDGGSVFWIVQRQIQARQPILGIDAVTGPDGGSVCRIRMGLPVVPVVPRDQRPVQGWRYLTPDRAPPDAQAVDGTGDLPPALVAELRALGAW